MGRPASQIIAEPTVDAAAPRLRWFVGFGLLLGLGLWAWLGVEGTWTRAQVVGIAIAGGAALFPPTRRSVARAIGRLNAAGPPALRVAAVIVFVASALYLVSTAIFQRRDL